MEQEEKVCVQKKRSALKDFFEKEHTPLEKGLMVASGVLVGLVIGFTLSPVKMGISIGSQNGCNNDIRQSTSKNAK